jgi:hypothetical protein
VIRTGLFLCCAFVSLVTSVSGALGSVTVIAQKSSSAANASVELRNGLRPDHHYEINVSSPKHWSFSGMGFENYVFTSGRQLSSGTKGLSFSGKTPFSFRLDPPRAGKLGAWIVVADIHLTEGRGLTVRLLDLGKHR